MYQHEAWKAEQASKTQQQQELEALVLRQATLVAIQKAKQARAIAAERR